MRNPKRESVFRFKQFSVANRRSAMKVGTDGVLVGAWSDMPGGVPTPRILDIGCGTGLIALMLAQRFPTALIDAVEIDADAAVEAQENVAASPWSDRISVHNIDISDYTPPMKYDLIVSNPPFFTNGIASADSARAQARHVGSLTFDTLFYLSASMLADNGTLSIITPADGFDIITEIARKSGLHPRKSCKVYPTPDKPCRRILSSWQLSSGEFVSESLTIELERHKYTPEYIALTHDFYLKM